jgi:CheY-like chemotaxis protein
MNAVIGMTGLLLDTELNSQQQDFTETIRVSGDSLLTLINEILDFSKLEAGEMELEVLDFDLGACVEEVVDLLAVPAHSKGIEIATLIEQNVPTYLRGDIARLRQVLMNLTGNAIKFTSVGEVVVHISLLSETSTAATILFSINDTGIGIPIDAQQKLFQPFTQVDASTTRKYGGTGLGLAICKQLVELMAGTIGVESQVEVGSKFWFTVSFEKQLHPVIQQSVRSTPNLLSGRKLLVVDDNATNRKIVRLQVSSWGIQVDEAESAATALTALQTAVSQEQPYDLAILDMQMPEMDGEMLAQQIKANPSLLEIRLIMMTSLNQRKTQRSLGLGFSAYLVKPIKQSRLFDCLMEVMTQDGSETHLSHQASSSSLTKNLDSSSSPRSFEQPKLKILLAEDSLINQKVALNQLKNLGYEADVAANGQEVLELTEKISYDLILMDCQMPILDGYDTTQKIRSLEGETRHTVIIALTANAMKEDRERCLAAGMDDYLSKPVSKQALSCKLAHWSQKTHSIENSSTSKQKSLSLTDSLIDWGYLHQISNDDQAFERELLHLFIETIPRHLEKIQTAIAASDFPTIKQEAHFIKGSSANVGAIEVEASALSLDEQAKLGELQTTTTSLITLIAAFNRVQMLIKFNYS